MSNRIYKMDIDIHVALCHAKDATCQSLTGCVLALATADALDLPRNSVSVGWDLDWTTKDNRAVITAEWEEGTHRWRGIIRPFDKAALYYSLNDDARRTLLRHFDSEDLTLTDIYGYVPGANKQYRSEHASPDERIYSKGYRDGRHGLPQRDEPEIINNESHLEKYLQGYEAGQRRRNNGGVPLKKMPSRQRRMNVV